MKSPSLPVRRGSIHALIGPNGAGRTTTLESIMGIVPRSEGSIAFEDEETIRLASNRIARRGIAWWPEERAIFASLDVGETLIHRRTVADVRRGRADDASGRMRTVFGPGAGAFTIIALEPFLADRGQWVTVITGAIFVVCVLAFRRGIVGEFAAWWASRRR